MASSRLRQVLGRIHGRGKRQVFDAPAMFIRSTLHGMASITQLQVTDHLALSLTLLRRLPQEMFALLGRALAQRAGDKA